MFINTNTIPFKNLYQTESIKDAPLIQNNPSNFSSNLNIKNIIDKLPNVKNNVIRIVSEEFSHQDPINPNKNDNFVKRILDGFTSDAFLKIDKRMKHIDDELKDMIKMQKSRKKADAENKKIFKRRKARKRKKIRKVNNRELVKSDIVFYQKGTDTIRIGYKLPKNVRVVLMRISKIKTNEGVFYKKITTNAAGLNICNWDFKDYENNPVPYGTYKIKIYAKKNHDTFPIQPYVTKGAIY
ncbi:hypothetical protein RJU59_01275 [Buchnera aphidicola (Kurisakia onigurumii)]|uniref:FlgD immunoglobulin-like domain containing protein n=1 Tax=Buchnera aphidicola TaxID=9 RepID=UPI0031B7391F